MSDERRPDGARFEQWPGYASDLDSVIDEVSWEPDAEHDRLRARAECAERRAQRAEATLAVVRAEISRVERDPWVTHAEVTTRIANAIAAYDTEASNGE